MNNLPKLEYVCLQELVAILGVTRQTIENWRQGKKIPKSRRVGIKTIFHLPSVLEACRRNCLNIDPTAYQLLDSTN